MRRGDDSYLTRQQLAKLLQSVAVAVGCGKTFAARAAVAALEPSRHHVVYCANPCVGGRGLLAMIVTALGGTPRFHRAGLVPQAADALATAEDERGRRVLVLIDEAHLLDGDQLEDLRMLGNAEMDSRSPAALLLIGQPTLRRQLRHGVMAAIDQRITLRVHIDGMDLAETGGYVKHRLSLCGRADPLFSDDAVAVSTTPPAGCPARSTTSPSKPSSPPGPPTRPSSTRPPPRWPSPKSMASSHARRLGLLLLP